MRERLKVCLNSLKAIAIESSKVVERISSTSERLSGKNSSTLFGCFGGLIAGLLAYVITLFTVAVSFPVLSVLLISLGIVGGVLFHRGNRRFRLERRIEENRLASDEILQRIKGLPYDTPYEVADGLWAAYQSLTVGLTAQTASVSTDSKKQLPAATEPLPPTSRVMVDGEVIDERKDSASQTSRKLLPL